MARREATNEPGTAPGLMLVVLRTMAEGAVGGARTRIATVAGGESNSPSLTSNVNWSLPTKCSAGVYVRSGGEPVRVPFKGAVTTAQVTLLPCGSEPVR